MPQKIKVKFSESQQKEVSPTTPQDSDLGIQKDRKSKKSKKEELTNISEDDTQQEFSMFPGVVIRNLAQLDQEKDVSDGSISDINIPHVKWPTIVDRENGVPDVDVCPTSVETDTTASNQNGSSCNEGVKMSLSNKISPCVKSDDQKFATTDYATSAVLSFIPTLIHPVNGQVSTFVRHREFTDYLRSSGILRLFGTCILNVYRMKTWPAPEKLMEEMLTSMGYQVPAKKQVDALNNHKQTLITKLKSLIKERCQLLERLDEFQDAAAHYELLDQDDILPPRPQNPSLNLDLMNDIFRNMKFVDVDHSGATELTTEVKPSVSKPAPVSDTLPIPSHDKRMLH